MISLLLKSSFRTIFLASNGLEAVQTVKNNPDINLVLMDINMPVMNGIQAMQEIKKILPELPVIAVTACYFDHDREQMLHEGFDDFLQKPFLKDMLLKKIQHYLPKDLSTVTKR